MLTGHRQAWGATLSRTSMKRGPQNGPRPSAVIPEAIEIAAEWEIKFKPKTEH